MESLSWLCETGNHRFFQSSINNIRMARLQQYFCQGAAHCAAPLNKKNLVAMEQILLKLDNKGKSCDACFSMLRLRKKKKCSNATRFLSQVQHSAFDKNLFAIEQFVCYLWKFEKSANFRFRTTMEGIPFLAMGQELRSEFSVNSKINLRFARKKC